MTTKPTELEESTELQNLAHADHGATAPAPEGAEPDTTDVAEFDLTDPNARAHTHERMAELRAKGPVAQVRFKRGGEDEDSEAQRQREAFFGDTVYVVTRYDEGTTALLDERFSVDPRRAMTPEQIAQLEQASPANTDFRALSRNLLSVDPPDHTRLRKLVQPSFTGGAMKALKPRIREIANTLLDDAERAAAERGESAPDRTMDLVQAFAYPLPVTVISDMLGIPAEDRSRVRGWTENLLRIDRGDGATEDAQRRLREFINYLKELFERRRHEPTDDLITQLVRAEEDGDKLDEDELMSMVFIVYIAGFVTTVNLIGNATVALLTHPEQRARFAADPSRVGSVV
ncbi:MAG: cytochrome P450, partial [Thermomicrobiales bacterium]|nr:cytochrome P450 [Thermomicrobiales bacterium]